MRSAVDRASRARALEALSELRAGRIGTGDFEAAWPWHAADPGVKAIGDELTWILLDDLRWNYRLVGKRALTPEGEALFDRCAAFLRSDVAYQWTAPPWRKPSRIAKWLRTVFGRARTRPEEDVPSGDANAWPFLESPSEPATRASQG